MVGIQASVESRSDERGALHYRIFVVHHTHWDREWWATFQDFRARLVELMDDLLDAIESDPSFRSFLLDSQMLVVQDYLEVRPENRERLMRAVRQGRIQCGPWYVLADEFLVSGEAHLRNLWLARRLSRQLDCPMIRVGYIPDAFGHIAQMPQILQGFGIDNALMWRGRGGEPRDVKQEFLWEAPDGSSVLTHWFPAGYYQMPFLHFDNPDRPYEDKVGRVFRVIEDLGARATTDVLLLPYGGDHRPADRRLAAKIDEANAAIGELGRIRWATIGEYITAVRERNPRLETVCGELRATGRESPHLLPGVLSARLYLKQRNARAETWLERYAEPLSALAWLRGSAYDDGLLWKAWELLVQNHPHDSICGCSIDQVHREMVPRFDQAEQIAQILAERSAQAINQRIDTSGLAPDERLLVAHNTLPWARTDWASVWVEREDIGPRTHRLTDAGGQEIPFQTRDVEGSRPRQEAWRHTEIGFVAAEVPGLGYRSYRLTRRERPLDPKRVFFAAVQPTAMLKGSDVVTDLVIGAGMLENRYLRVEIDGLTGTLSVTDKETGERHTGLNAFEDGGDAGDSYNYSRPLNDVVLCSAGPGRTQAAIDGRTQVAPTGQGVLFVHVSVAEAGYARGTLRVDVEWALPVGLSEDRLSRSAEYVTTRISSHVSLTAESRRVDIRTEWENRSRDHRLRALFPLGSDAAESLAESQFAVERRPRATDDEGRGWPELPASTFPQQGWMAVEHGGRGLLVANRGLPEYELLADGRGTLALTLLRAVGWLSREDLLSRIGGAGPTIPTPDAQSLGANSVHYSIVPYGGSWLGSHAYREAEQYRAPMYGSQLAPSVGRASDGALSRDAGVLELGGDHTLLLSACKRAEDGAGLILRFWNVATQPTEARVRLSYAPDEVVLVNLAEERIASGSTPIDADGSFTVRAGPAQIVSVYIAAGSVGL